MSRRLAAVPLALALLAGGLTAVVPGSFTAAARADEIYPVPDGGAWIVPGHGWGHGHGLSQWGAQGAASIGRTATEIVSAYYPNTTAATLAASTIRVVLTESGVEGYRPVGGDDHRYECDAAGAALSLRCYLEMLPATGLTATDLATGASLALPAGADRWAVNVDATGLHLYRYAGGSWSVVPVGGRTSLSGPVRLSGPPLLRMRYRDGTARDYRGVLDAVWTGPGRLARVSTLSLEDYLLGVVPREAPSSWLPAALQAQAVAARSYSAYVRAHAPAGAGWDICDSTWCQVFGGSAYYPVAGAGYSLEPATTTAAVRATAGMVRTYAGAPIFAQFSASNGGWSTDGGTPYLTAHPDTWDGVAPNPVHSWTASLSAAQLQTRYPAVGRLLRLRVLQRDGHGDWGGRVLAVALEGVDPAGRPTVVDRDPDGSPISGADIYAAHSWPAYADGLRSSWWTLQAPPASPSRTQAAVAPAAGRIDLLERSDSGTLEQRSWTAATGWSGPADLGGALLGGPAATAPSTGAVQVLARGTDGALYGRFSPSSGAWSGWTSWGGRLTARPAAVTTGGGRVDAFVRGTDGALYQRWSGPAGLAPGWVKIGGVLATGAGPAAAALGPGSPYLLVRGTDGALWSKYYRAGSWSGWTSMGGVASDDPAAVGTAPGRLAIFTKGVDGALWTRSLGAAGWSGWSSLGGALSSGPAAVVGSDGRLDVFVVGTDGHTYDRTRTTSWTGWVRVQ